MRRRASCPGVVCRSRRGLPDRHGEVPRGTVRLAVGPTKVSAAAVPPGRRTLYGTGGRTHSRRLRPIELLVPRGTGTQRSPATKERGPSPGLASDRPRRSDSFHAEPSISGKGTDRRAAAGSRAARAPGSRELNRWQEGKAAQSPCAMPWRQLGRLVPRGTDAPPGGWVSGSRCSSGENAGAADPDSPTLQLHRDGGIGGAARRFHVEPAALVTAPLPTFRRLRREPLASAGPSARTARRPCRSFSVATAGSERGCFSGGKRAGFAEVPRTSLQVRPVDATVMTSPWTSIPACRPAGPLREPEPEPPYPSFHLKRSQTSAAGTSPGLGVLALGPAGIGPSMGRSGSFGLEGPWWA